MKPISRHLLRAAASVVALLLLTACTDFAGHHTLYRGTHTRYTIFLPDDASPSERSAAEELQQVVQQMGGPLIPLTATRTGSHQLLVGVAPEGVEKPQADDETFTYRTVGNNLYIWGGADRGTMYGVYRLLQQQWGVRWYTPTCTVIPQQKRCSFGRLDVTQTPAVPFRQLDYFTVSSQPQWLAHNLVNTNHTPQENQWGGLISYRGCHTMPAFVPYSLFDEHPEYFCMRDGKRQNHGQLCLSNPDVLQLCKEGVLKRMRDEPLPRIYSLSQDDNFSYCQCPECQAIEAQYGGQHSGIMLWFVNQVADYVRDEFPDKYVGTFAYQYTRTPPTGITPRDNVVVRLCSIECCFGHPFTAGCEQNEAFMRDLQTWGQLAPHLFIWDYVVDYAQYLAPWPNFQVLAENIRTLRDNHAIGIYEESCYNAGASEFADMKAWVLAELLWNPDQDVEPLVDDFIRGYYGQAAPQVRAYYDLCQSMVTPDVHYGIFIHHDHPLYTDEFLTAATDILTQARAAAADDETLLERVDIVRMQVLYLYSVRHFAEARADGSWDELKQLARRHNAQASEWKPLETWINEMESQP